MLAGPIVYIPVSECQGWLKELEARISRIEAEKRQSREDVEVLGLTQNGDAEA